MEYYAGIHVAAYDSNYAYLCFFGVCMTILGINAF